MTMRAIGLPLATVLEPILSGHERDHVSFERTGSTKTTFPYGDSTEIGRTADRQPVLQLIPRQVTKLHTILDMALPLLPGLTPPEVAFLCEMELITVIP